VAAAARAEALAAVLAATKSGLMKLLHVHLRETSDDLRNLDSKIKEAHQVWFFPMQHSARGRHTATIPFGVSC
jgi:hypothetical protein